MSWSTRSFATHVEAMAFIEGVEFVNDSSLVVWGVVVALDAPLPYLVEIEDVDRPDECDECGAELTYGFGPSNKHVDSCSLYESDDDDELDTCHECGAEGVLYGGGPEHRQTCSQYSALS